jgi:hypothetical protein
MKEFLCDNKNLITVAVLLLGVGAYIWSYLTTVSAENIITAIVSGLFGMGTGAALRATARSTDKPEDK